MARIVPIRDQFEKWKYNGQVISGACSETHRKFSQALGEIMFRENVLTQSDHEC